MKMFTQSICRTVLLFVASFSMLPGQQGDQKEKEKDLLSSLNWKKWSPGVVPVYSAEDSLARFKVAPGFKVELVASEPFVKDPVFVDWDDQGRMWVGELRSYMMNLDGSGENQPISRVMVLEDTDQDGKMDKATPFLEDMVMSAVLLLLTEVFWLWNRVPFGYAVT